MIPSSARVFGAVLLAGIGFTAHAQLPDPSRLGYAARPLSVPSLHDDHVRQQTDRLSLEDENPFAPESPGDEDIGQQLILKETPKSRWMSAQVDTFLYWTDNPANLANGGDDDFFYGGRVSLSAQPRLGPNLFGDLLVSQYIYLYDQYDFLDYEYFEASAGLIKVLPQLWNSIVFVQGHYGRMTTDTFGEDILNAFSLRAGMQRSFLFDRKNSLHINVMGDWDLDVDVAELERFEYVVDLAYTYKIMRDLILSASYRFTWFDYQNVGRSDALSLLGLSLTWSPRRWIDLYLAASYSINESDIDVFDYEAATTGGGAGVRLRF
jgi:hypothetical protein